MKVLILAYDFPPYVSVGGLRPYSWFRYLSEFGVEPTVVTRQWENRYGDERDYVAPSATTVVEVERSDRGTLVRSPYAPNLSNRLLLSAGPGKHRVLRKVITAFYEIGQYYVPIGPKANLFHAARHHLAKHKVDAIIATGDPFVLFAYGARLSKEFGIPWVADYRDPWSQDTRRPRVLRWWEARIERHTVASASAITTASGFFKHLIAQLHPGRLAEVIPNGYDPEATGPAENCPQGRHTLTIAFTGTISPWHPVESVFAVFDDFIGTHPDRALRLHMVGVNGSEDLGNLLLAKFPRLAGSVKFTRRLPNHEAALALADANAFLLFNMYAHSGTKVFDYLALKRRILLCYSDDPMARQLKDKHYNMQIAPDVDVRVLERMVQETNSGVVVRDAPHLREALADLYREFKTSGRVACESVGIERYSRQALAGQLARVLKGLAS